MDEPIPVSFGYWLRRRRKALDLTQAELGRRSGCSAAAVRKIEADERRPSLELAGLLADALEIKGEEREAFLRAARRQAVQMPEAPLSGAPAMATPNDLPAPLTSLVDRRHDIPAVTALLRRPDVRLLTLTGPPGIGKTRLSIQAAGDLLGDFPGGVWFVDLAPIVDPDDVLSAIARHGGIHELADGSLVRRFRAAWQNQKVLLVLDNFEQVVDAALQVTALLRECRDLKVLATSRMALQVYGEHEYPVPPLSVPPPGAGPDTLMTYESVELFVARARQHQPTFRIDANTAGPVADICRKMEGLSLAIELAAATLRSLSLEELAAELGRDRDWLHAFRSPARDLPQRQQTLASAIAWSYVLLDPDSQACLRRLSAFTASFALEAATAVCAASTTETRHWLAKLVDHSLLAPERGRWRQLEMIREFAWSQSGSEERVQAQQRHAAYFHQQLRQQPARSASAVAEDYDNYVAALRWLIEVQQATAALEMCASLSWYWETQGYVHEGLAMVRDSLALPGAVDPQIRFNALYQAAIFAWQRHDFATALALGDQAIAVARIAGLAGEIAGLLNLMGRIHIEEGDFVRAEAALRESLNLARQHPDPSDAGFPITQLGEIAWAEGDLITAQALFDEALAVVPPSAMGVSRAMLHTDRAELALVRGDAELARHELRQALPSSRDHVRRFRYWLVTLAGLKLSGGHATKTQASEALQCLAAEEGLGEQGAPLSPVYQPLIARRLATARALLPEPDRTVLWVTARRWTMAQALAQAERWLEG